MLSFASSIKARLVTCLVGTICLLFLLALYLQYSLKMTSQSNPGSAARVVYVSHLDTVPRYLVVMRIALEGYGQTGDARYLQAYYEAKALLDAGLYDSEMMSAGERFGGTMDRERRQLIEEWQKDFDDVIPASVTPPVTSVSGEEELTPTPKPPVVQKKARTEEDWERGREKLREIGRRSSLISSIVTAQIHAARDAELLGAIYYVLFMWAAVSFVGVFTILIQQIIARSIISPLTVLGQAVRRLKAGDYTVRAPVKTMDEIGTLAAAFNSMAESIQENQRVLEAANRRLSTQQDELQNVNQELERRVEEKTEELKKTLALAESDATKLQMIINRMPDGLVMLGERCRILSANAAGLHILGHKDAASVQDWIDTKPGAFSFRQMNHLSVGREEMPFARAGRGESFSNVSLYVRGSDNQTRLVSFSAGPILLDTAGSVTLSVCIFRDVTLELALRQELEEKNMKLAEAARLKDEFLATLSHELRTPLTPVVSHAHLLLNATRLADEDTHSLRVIERNARALSRMIDELLDLSGIMNRKLRLLREPTQMNEWVQQTLETIRPAAEKKRQALSYHPCAEEVCLHIDPARLTQVLVNLVTNAVKYTDEGGRIDVTLSATAHDVLVQVRDNGSGLSRHDMREIFAMFHQTRSSMTRRAGGLGIGLSVAKSLAELHGGDIAVESDGPGQGSTFTLRLPRVVRTTGAGDGESAASGMAEGGGGEGGGSSGIEGTGGEIPISGDGGFLATAGKGQSHGPGETDMHMTAHEGGYGSKGVHLPPSDKLLIPQALPLPQAPANGGTGGEGSGGGGGGGSGREGATGATGGGGSFPSGTVAGSAVRNVTRVTAAGAGVAGAATAGGVEATSASSIAAGVAGSEGGGSAAPMDRRLLRGRRILLVEDSEDTLDALCRILARRECTVYTACDGRTGLETARRERPDIILSDIGLPLMDGLEMARHIRADIAMRDIILVASSGLGRPQDIEAALAVGFAAHLLKPVDIAALDALLLRLLAERAGRESSAGAIEAVPAFDCSGEGVM